MMNLKQWHEQFEKDFSDDVERMKNIRAKVERESPWSTEVVPTGSNRVDHETPCMDWVDYQ